MVISDLFPNSARVAFVADPTQVTEASLHVRRGFSLCDAILVVALAIALFEPWLANRISKKHYGKPAGTMVEPPRERGGRLGRIFNRGPPATSVAE